MPYATLKIKYFATLGKNEISKLQILSKITYALSMDAPSFPTNSLASHVDFPIPKFETCPKYGTSIIFNVKKLCNQ
jgi:hypothetical protein